ncbi:component of SufBCD complex [Rhodobacterales bacterium HKCCE2091]|nr:component of SufBCD complex [Rhodobacterales bacterium HKCCE2091]
MLERAREVIDLRSFSNLWYWIVLAVLWSTFSHWCLGVPFDLVVRARRGHEQSARDLQILAEVNANRVLSLAEASGILITAITAFLLTGLLVLGWVYGSEFCQATFLLAFPMVLIGVWSVRTARVLTANGFADVAGALRFHRLGVQLLGIVFIFITAFWGMYVNVTVDPLIRMP